MSVFLLRHLQSNSRSAGSAGQTLPWTGQTRHPRSRLESPPLVEHELKMFNYRWAALGAGANLQHWEAKGNLNISHVTAPFFASCNGRSCFLRGLSGAVVMQLI